MARQQDGSYRAVVTLADGTYQYKFFINGVAADMCHDRTWGHPAATTGSIRRGRVRGRRGRRPERRGLRRHGSRAWFSATTRQPAHVSAAGGRLSVRFRPMPA
jgi:hypothetical protein